MEQHPEWTTKYRLFANHGQAMDVIADKLSQECGLTLRAIPVWMGSGRMGYAMVFPDGSMGPKELTRENVESLKKMERFLKSAGILEMDGFKLEHLYSALCLGHYDEPPEMARKPLPQGWAAKTDEDLHNVLVELKEKRRESAKGSRRCVPSDHQVPNH